MSTFVKILHLKMRTSDSPYAYHALPTTAVEASSDEKRTTLSMSAPFKQLREALNRALVAARSCRDESTHASKDVRPTAWLDGLRGIAAFIVYIEHFALPYFQDDMLLAYGSPGATSIWQLPLIRLCYSGTAMVSVFFVVSGCALSLKTLSLAHTDQHHAAFDALSSSIFRRAIRLFAPTTIATFLILILVQLRFYEHPYPVLEIHGRRHMVLDRPPRLESFWLQLRDWIEYLFARLYFPATWMNLELDPAESPIYASQLWTIPVEFYASMALYVSLTGLMNVRRAARNALLAAVTGFALRVGRWDVMLFMVGAVLADFVVQSENTRNDERAPEQPSTVLLRICTAFLNGLSLLSAVLLLSYPDHEAESNPTYFYLAEILDDNRIWQSLGAVLLLFCCIRMALLRSLLTFAPIRYLGDVSYGLYIVHIPILASYGWTLVPFIWENVTGKESWGMKMVGFFLGLSALTPLTLGVATVWTRWIDLPCQEFAKWLERTFRTKAN